MKFAFVSLMVGSVALLSAQSIPAPQVPEKIKTPASEQVVLEAHAEGSQIYTCAQTADGKYGWTLKAPEADLHDRKGAVIGHHYAGPSWKSTDGSEVKGKMSAKVDAPEANAIPWLLLSATGHSGDGILSRVTSIQRINTQGGQPPTAGCDASKQGSETKSTYTAVYYFYAPPK